MNLHFRSLAAALSLVMAAPQSVLLAQPAAQQQVPAATTAPTSPAAPQTTPALPPPAATSAPAATAPVASPAAPEAAAPDAPPAAAPAIAEPNAELDVAPADPAAGAPQAGTIPAHMLPHDLTPWQMFLDADIVVKAVMIGLVLASIVTWTVWFAKSLEIRFEKRRARRKNRWLEHARSLDEAERQFARDKDPVARLVRAAAHEVELSHTLPKEGVKERIVWQLERVEGTASRRIGNGMGVLATIGATSPFVGLFGTVWGIMNSFIGISKAHSTSLAVVAPGIAEALLATAMGLVAAIFLAMAVSIAASLKKK